MKKKVTIQDIADALGISRNTVSKAINNSDGLADATRERILQKAVEMGYKQFSYVSMFAGAARSSSPLLTEGGESSGEIALFTTAFLGQSHFASLMLDRLQRDLSQLGYTLNTHRITPENRTEKTLPITFRRERTAAILCVEMFDRAYGEMICSQGLPVLFVDGPPKENGFSLPADQLYMDNTSELTRFVRDMLARGKRRIGFLGNPYHCQSFFERYSAFRCAMLLAGVPVKEDWCVESNNLEELTEKLTALPALPEVFICANDFVAVDAVQVLRRLGKSVPGDVAVCGFDDAAESRLCDPPLTTVHIHTQIMAFSAAQLLISRIREPSLDFRTVHTETELIYRESTGLPPEGGL